MKAPRYELMVEGDNGWCAWVQPIHKGYRMRCCDCALVHEMEFRVQGGRIQFRAKRLMRHTAASRRAQGVRLRTTEAGA